MIVIMMLIKRYFLSDFVVLFINRSLLYVVMRNFDRNLVRKFVMVIFIIRLVLGECKF